MASNYRTFFAICMVVGKDYKEAVYEFTEGRTVSLSSLNDGELKELLIKAKSWQAPKPRVYV